MKILLLLSLIANTVFTGVLSQWDNQVWFFEFLFMFFMLFTGLTFVHFIYSDKEVLK